MEHSKTFTPDKLKYNIHGTPEKLDPKKTWCLSLNEILHTQQHLLSIYEIKLK